MTSCVGQPFCEKTVFSPSGPTTIKEWRKGSDAVPLRIEISGAKSGQVLTGRLRLMRSQNGQWSALQEKGTTTHVFSPGDIVPKSMDIREIGYCWRLTVLGSTEPVEQPGIATEDEPKLHVVLKRLGKIGKDIDLTPLT